MAVSFSQNILMMVLEGELDTEPFQTILYLIPPLPNFILPLLPRTNLDNRPQIRNSILHSLLQRRSITRLSQ